MVVLVFSFKFYAMLANIDEALHAEFIRSESNA